MSEPTLAELRNQIDEINLSLAKLLEQRFDILDEVSMIKEEQSLDLYDQSRTEKMNMALKKAFGQSAQFESINKTMNEIFKISVEHMK